MKFPGKYIISGGPGSGKSTLLGELAQMGYFCSEEVSRKMIIQEVAKGSCCLPWLDISCFSTKVLADMIIAWNQVPADRLVFFDRGIPDAIAYLKVAGLEVKPDYYSALARHPYQHQVFILPPWEEIYVHDSERWQSFEEAVSIHAAITETYSSCGFEIIDVPRLSVAHRAAYILDFIK